jgi:hypothetical protein
MPLQRINWLQIDTENVPSGAVIDIGKIDGPLHAGYFENLYVSGSTLSEIIAGAGTDALNQFSASVLTALEFTGSNLTVKGDLLVKGTTTAINSTIVDLGDNIISLNGTEASFGGIQVNDPTNPNQVSGSLLWDTTNDRWIGGPLGSEEPFIQETQFNNFSSSLSDALDQSGIWWPTGSYHATTNDLQITGSVKIKGDLSVEGTTILFKDDPSLNSLIVSGAMSVVKNQYLTASITIEDLGTLANVTSNIHVIDCGDFF